MVCVLAICLNLSGCGVQSVTDKKISFSHKEVDYAGTYTGDLDKNIPVGEGTFISDEGWSIQGTFENGTFVGEITDVQSVITYNSHEYFGNYTGNFVIIFW